LHRAKKSGGQAEKKENAIEKRGNKKKAWKSAVNPERRSQRLEQSGGEKPEKSEEDLRIATGRQNWEKGRAGITSEALKNRKGKRGKKKKKTGSAGEEQISL